MAQPRVAASLTPIVDAVARAVGARGLSLGAADDSPRLLRIRREENVRRTIQAYWTPFQANVPGDSVGLHLEVAGAQVHWAEAYLSPRARNWVFCFQQRADGDVQLAYYRDHGEWADAIESFFSLAGWYVLIPSEATWKDVVYEVADDLDWSDHHTKLAGSGRSVALQDSLKKSTIVWLNWKDAATGEHTMPVWYVYDQKAAKMYVLSGERQQTLPGARNIRHARVIFREKGKNVQVAEVPAAVRVIEPGDDWDEVAEKIADKRLNIPGLPEDTARRWRDECVILELTLLN